MKLQKEDFLGRNYIIDTEDPIIITLDGEQVNYSKCSGDDQRQIDQSINLFEEGANELVEVDDILCEKMWDGVYTFRRKAHFPNEKRACEIGREHAVALYDCGIDWIELNEIEERVELIERMTWKDFCEKAKKDSEEEYDFTADEVRRYMEYYCGSDIEDDEIIEIYNCEDPEEEYLLYVPE